MAATLGYEQFLDLVGRLRTLTPGLVTARKQGADVAVVEALVAEFTEANQTIRAAGDALMKQWQRRLREGGPLTRRRVKHEQETAYAAWRAALADLATQADYGDDYVRENFPTLKEIVREVVESN